MINNEHDERDGQSPSSGDSQQGSRGRGPRGGSGGGSGRGPRGGSFEKRDPRESGPRRGDDRDGDSFRERSEFEESVVRVSRCATVVKGGRRFSFSAVVVVGDGNGRVGIGHGKAKEVPNSIQKAIQNAKKDLYKVELLNETIPHEVVGHFGSAWVKLLPAAPGTGVIAGPSVRAVVERVGIRNILTKSFGNCNSLNLVKATLEGLKMLRSKETVEKLRGVKL